MAEYIMTVGLEVHVELKTKTKIFCACPVEFGAAPNTHICPVCMGLPGALPRLNAKAIEYAIKAGLVTNCEISETSEMDRKNYFYPDLPKAFQISQNEIPLCKGGYLDVNTPNGIRRIGIERIHVEEDAGKLVHNKSGDTLIDYNRCGTPLIEIMSKPDISSSDEAKAYLKKLRSLLLYTGISDCKMNEGSLRCDVNISVREKGSDTLGIRTEIKNINSFSFVAKAIDAEFSRQTEILKNGGKVVCETRRYNASSGKTERMRVKESADDYRYFPEPDLISVRVSPADVKRIASELPILPDVRFEKYTKKLGLSQYDADLLASDMALSDFFDVAEKYTKHKKILANILLGEILRLCDSEDFFCPISPEAIAELATFLGEERINSSTGKKLTSRLWQSAENGIYDMPSRIVDAESLWQINSEEQLLKLVRSAIENDPRSAAAYKSGKTNALRAITGKIMAQTSGLANPMITEKLIIKELTD